jgi:Spy/CpxP family protein refolding chaperone
MITVAKIKVYQRFAGDIDGFARGGTPAEKGAITGEEWSQIEQLLQRLSLMKNMPVADSYRSETTQLLSASVSDEAALAELNKLAR